MAEERILPTSDPEPQLLDRPRGRLAYVDEGPRGAPAFFTLHGIPGSIRDFRYLAPPLAARLRLVRLDLPGFGASAPDERATASLRGRAEAVLELADHLGLRRFGLLAHSMGGGAALALAASRPDRVSHLALVASVGLTRHRALGMSPKAFRAFGRALGLPGLGSLLAPLTRSAYRRRRFPGADRLVARELSLHLRSIGALDFGELRAAVAAGLPPTLVAFSQDDRLLEPAIGEELARSIPGARRLAFESGGHNLQKTRAPELAEAIVAML